MYEVATRAQLPGDGEEWHAMRAGRSGGLPASRSPELGKLVRQVSGNEKPGCAMEMCLCGGSSGYFYVSYLMVPRVLYSSFE